MTITAANRKTDAIALRWTGILLVTTVWVSSALFGLYILAFYASALYQGEMERWNEVLPKLYEQGFISSTSGIGLHFASGGIILLMGSIQLIKGVRIAYPSLHRWVGRIYIIASLLAAIGGLVFIITRGTIGGTVMNIGFSLYGVLMFIAAIQTYRYAVAGRVKTHRAWALRLYALAIGSWLYRIDYGFWIMLADGAGHTKAFNGIFDHVMSFFFYIPNLLVAEVFIRAKTFRSKPVFNWLTTLVLLVTTGFLVIGTYYFTKIYWGPAILDWISGTDL